MLVFTQLILYFRVSLAYNCAKCIWGLQSMQFLSSSNWACVSESDLQHSHFNMEYNS